MLNEDPGAVFFAGLSKEKGSKADPIARDPVGISSRQFGEGG